MNESVNVFASHMTNEVVRMYNTDVCEEDLILAIDETDSKFPHACISLWVCVVLPWYNEE